MIRLGANDKHRNADVRQRDHLSIQRELVGGKFVIQIKTIEVLGVHPIRHACAIGIPGHQVNHRIALPLKIGVDDGLPDQIL